MKRNFICIVCILMCILIIYISFNAVAIYNYGNKDGKQKSDVAIILGAATDSEGVSPV